MLDIYDYITVALIGTVGAFISGLLGVGGGIIFIPVLKFYLIKAGISGEELVRFTLANSFFVIVFAGIIISIRQKRSGNFYIKPVIYTSIPGIISSLLVTLLILEISWYNESIFKIVFLSLLIPLTFRMLFSKKKNDSKEINFPSYKVFGITGFFTGIITSLSGLGGGIVMVPVFTDLLKIPIKVATSISTGVIPLFTVILVIPYMFRNPVQVSAWQTGYILYPLTAPLILSVLFISPQGVKLAHKMKAATLRYIFACIAITIITKELWNFFI